MGAYMILCLRQPVKVVQSKFSEIEKKLLPYCDSGVRMNDFELTLRDCLRAIDKAQSLRLYNWKTFDVD